MTNTILQNGWSLVSWEAPDGTILKEVVPVNDLKEHSTGIGCWCKPFIDEECSRLLVHNSLDRREEFEEGRKLS